VGRRGSSRRSRVRRWERDVLMDSPASVTMEGLAFVEREPTCRRMEENVNSWNPKFEGVYYACQSRRRVLLVP
jgi:hypothetical protein